jgi:hypothetical protein
VTECSLSAALILAPLFTSGALSRLNPDIESEVEGQRATTLVRDSPVFHLDADPKIAVVQEAHS